MPHDRLRTVRRVEARTVKNADRLVWVEAIWIVDGAAENQSTDKRRAPKPLSQSAVSQSEWFSYVISSILFAYIWYHRPKYLVRFTCGTGSGRESAVALARSNAERKAARILGHRRGLVT